MKYALVLLALVAISAGVSAQEKSTNMVYNGLHFKATDRSAKDLVEKLQKVMQMDAETLNKASDKIMHAMRKRLDELDQKSPGLKPAMLKLLDELINVIKHLPESIAKPLLKLVENVKVELQKKN